MDFKYQFIKIDHNLIYQVLFVSDEFTEKCRKYQSVFGSEIITSASPHKFSIILNGIPELSRDYLYLGESKYRKGYIRYFEINKERDEYLIKSTESIENSIKLIKSIQLND